MAFNTVNYSGSLVYKEYEKVFNEFYSAGYQLGPYKKIKDYSTKIVGYESTKTPLGLNVTLPVLGKQAFKDVVSEIANSNNTYYQSIIPYFFLNYICSDNVSEIKNTGQSFEDLKVPIDYFTDARVFGVKTRFDSVKNGSSLNQDNGWSFFSVFDSTKTISNTNDLDKVIEGIFYNTLFQYFNVDKYYSFSLINAESVSYTTKGYTTVSKKGETTYVNGIGEAPNYLNISVDSYQKIKNKVSIKSTAVRTNYNSQLLPPKQIAFKDTNEEFLSGVLLRKPLTIPFSSFSYDELALLTSLSEETSADIIKNYIVSVAEYFNLIHYVLKNAIIDLNYYQKFSTAEDNIFNNPGTNTVINNLSKLYKNNDAVKRLGIYTKDLLINLLNIVGDEMALDNICNTFLDFLEENKPQVIGNYKREELFNFFKQLNKASFDTFKEPYPQTYLPSKDAKVRTTMRISGISLNNQVVHSNDLILQNVYVYRTTEKPSIYEDILQDINLYKKIPVGSRIIEQKTVIIDDGVSLVDNIEPNKKYYYCFLSEREYDIFKEVLLYYKGSRIVQHFSAPTKILELEMISTDNSTYLDYNFFVPQQKEFYNKKKNFLSKIKVSASDLQKVYDTNLEKFVPPQNTMKLWDDTVKLVNSYDLTTGLTVKLRLASPKTNRKLDLNLRYFLNSGYPSIKTQTSFITMDDVKRTFGDKKIKEVFTSKYPKVDLKFYSAPYEKVEDIVKIPQIQNNFELKIIKYPDGKIAFKNFPQIWGIPVVTDGFTNFVKKMMYTVSTSYFKPTDPITKPSKIDTFSYPPDSIDNPDVIVPWSNFPISDFINKNPDFIASMLVINQSTKDNYGLVTSSSLTAKVTDVTPSYGISGYKTSYNEGDSINFTILSVNVADGTNLQWKITGQTNASDFVSNVLKGSVAVKNNSANIKLDVINDLLTEGNESFKLTITDPEGFSAETANIVINDTSTTPKPTFKLNGPATINEGTSASFIVNTTNYNGPPIPWEIKSPGNNFANNTSGVVSISNNSGTFLISAANNNVKEGNRTFDLVLHTTTAGDIKFTFTVVDTSLEPYIITPNSLVINEGENVTFLVDAPYKKDGELVYWQLNQVKGTFGDSDFSNVYTSNNSGGITISPTKLKGSFVVKSKQGSVSFLTSKDSFTEGLEQFSISLRDTETGSIIKTSQVVSINDLSIEPYYVTNLKNYLFLKSGKTILNEDLTANITAKNSTNDVWGGADTTPYYTDDSDFQKAILHAFSGIKDGQTIKVKFNYVGKVMTKGSLKNNIQTKNTLGMWESWKISQV